MSTSLNIQGLSKYRNNFIFISKERTSRVEFDLKTLSQESIDNAFKKQARRTKALDQLNEYTIVLLETNYTNKYEIIDFDTAYNGVFEQCFQKYLNTFDKNIF